MQRVFARLASFGWPVALVGKFIGNSNCADTLFYSDFLDKICLSLAISKTLGYVMLVGGFLYKLPVILNIFKAGGGDGLNLVGLYLETSSYIAGFYYSYLKGYEISTYGNKVASSIQDCIIITIVWYFGVYGKPITKIHMAYVFGFSLFFATFLYYASKEETTTKFIVVYQYLVITLSRLPQIYSNFSAKSAGVQSPISLLTALFGAFAELVVNLVETKNTNNIIGSIIVMAVNVTLFAQVLYLKSGKQKNSNPVDGAFEELSFKGTSDKSTLRKRRPERKRTTKNVK